MTKKWTLVLARLVRFVPKTASKARKPFLPETSDIRTMQAYLSRWALTQLRRELKSHPERFGELRARILDQLTQDDRPVEDKSAEEEFQRNPKFRVAVLRLYLEKKRQELGVSDGTGRRGKGQVNDEGYCEGGEDELTQFAEQSVIDELERSWTAVNQRVWLLCQGLAF